MKAQFLDDLGVRVGRVSTNKTAVASSYEASRSIIQLDILHLSVSTNCFEVLVEESQFLNISLI